MKLLVVAGASGGHIFPALAFLDSIREKAPDTEMLFVLSDRSMKSGIIPHAVKWQYISTSAVGLNLSVKNITALLKFMRASLKSLVIFLRFNPDTVVGFGSLDSLSLLLCGWLFRRNTLIHEQNVVPGRANRLLARFVDRVAISFAETGDCLGIDRNKVVLTGNPIRRQLKKVSREEALGFFGLRSDRPVLLIAGGSQGSHNINILVQKALSLMPQGQRPQVIHLCGQMDLKMVEEGYRNSGISAKVFSFLEQMQYAYSASDLAVCRAGATTIAELGVFGLPALIIPYPFAYTHQVKNARILEKAGSAVVLDESGLDAEGLKSELTSLICSDKLKDMRRAYGNMKVIQADELLADEVLNINR